MRNIHTLEVVDCSCETQLQVDEFFFFKCCPLMVNVGLASQTVDQKQANIGSTSRICWIPGRQKTLIQWWINVDSTCCVCWVRPSSCITGYPWFTMMVNNRDYWNLVHLCYLSMHIKWAINGFWRERTMLLAFLQLFVFESKIKWKCNSRPTWYLKSHICPYY